MQKLLKNYNFNFFYYNYKHLNSFIKLFVILIEFKFFKYYIFTTKQFY